jgi:nucleotide-binding universal stress UspA family protein
MADKGEGKNRLRRVLVPFDGSMITESALPYACVLAERLDADVELLAQATPRGV